MGCEYQEVQNHTWPSWDLATTVCPLAPDDSCALHMENILIPSQGPQKFHPIIASAPRSRISSSKADPGSQVLFPSVQLPEYNSFQFVDF